MIKGRGVSIMLFLLVLAARPHMAGGAYPFSQGLVLIPALVALAMLFLTADRTPLPGRTFLGVVSLPWVLMLWSLVSLFWTTDPGQGVRESGDLLCNLAVFSLVFVLVLEKPALLQRFLPVSILVIIPVLASAFYQRLFGLGKIRQTLLKMDPSGESVANLAGLLSQNRVFAGFLNSNMLAGFLAVTIPLTLDLALGAVRRGRILYFWALTALQVAVLLLTGSLGGILAGGVMAAGVLVLRRGIRARDIVLGCVLAGLLAAGFFSIRGVGFLGGPDSSILQRFGYMAAGVRMASMHPILGWGAGSGPGALMGFVSEGVRPVADPHNFLVRAWISWGLTGLVLLALFISLWLKSIMAYFRDQGVRTVPEGFAGLVLGSGAFLLHSLMDMDFFVPETALFGWCALGAALGVAAAGSRAVAREGAPGHLNLVRTTAGGMVLALVLPAFVIFHGESVAFRGQKAMAAQDYEAAAGLFSAAADILPFNGRIKLEEGRALFIAGDRAGARARFQEADGQLRASPYPSWELGRLLQAEGKWAASIPPLEKALARFNTSPRIRIDLARAHLNLGDKGQALFFLTQARRYATFDRQAARAMDEVLSGAGP